MAFRTLQFTPSLKEGIPLENLDGEDPTVQELEAVVAKMFGHQAALYCVSGTMSNQIGVLAQTRPGDEVICSELCHLYHYEAGGLAANAGVQVRLLSHDRRPGQFSASRAREVVRAREDVHYARTALIAVEDTSNRGGGSVWPRGELEALRELCMEESLMLHLDGARVWNRFVVTGEDPSDYGGLFDSLSLCLSKGLGAPMGSLLVGSHNLIERARWYRKRLGGGTRQAGFMAAAGLYAVRHHLEGLERDHANARHLAYALKEASQLFSEVSTPETNIVLARFAHDEAASAFKAQAARLAVRYGHIDAQTARFVTHQDVRDERALKAVREVLAQSIVS